MAVLPIPDGHARSEGGTDPRRVPGCAADPHYAGHDLCAEEDGAGGIHAEMKGGTRGVTACARDGFVEMKSIRYIFFFMGLGLPFAACSQRTAFRDSLIRLSAEARGTVGISILPLEAGDTLSINGGLHLPMLSVFKFPLAITVL